MASNVFVGRCDGELIELLSRLYYYYYYYFLEERHKSRLERPHDLRKGLDDEIVQSISAVVTQAQGRWREKLTTH